MPLHSLKLLLALAGGLLLSSCLPLQLSGSVSEVTVTVTPLRQPELIIEQVTTASLAQTRSNFGTATWDGYSEALQLLLLSNANLDDSLYDETALYLVTASGGLAHDINSDKRFDATTTPVIGQWHAILSGAQLQAGRVSTLTEAIYRSLELELSQLSDTALVAALDAAAQSAVPDLDKSGSVNYTDALRWNRYARNSDYLHALSRVDELSAAIRDGADVATIRNLSQLVLGQDTQPQGPFSISGTITVNSSTRVDSDVNDIFAPYADNSTLEKAQNLINPAILGGYANLPNQGAEGNSFVFGDSEDFFRADLLQGQLLSLVMADDPLVNDLDLFLYAENGDIIDASLGLSEIEQITVPASGTYLIGVSAFAGASNYRLTVGIGEANTQSERLRLSDDFVPGDIIARFREGEGRVDTMSKRVRLTGMRIRGGLQRANLLTLPQDRQGPRGLQQRKLKTLYALKRLRRQQEVESADLNYYVRPAALPNDAFYYQQAWHYEMINLPAAWDRSTGDDVIVAVIDTGILLNHPDLAGKLVAGYDFVDMDSSPADPGDLSGSARSTFHGTHVAGTVGAATNNGGRGVAGVGWNAKVMPLRALAADGGTTYDVLQAVRFAAGLPNDSGQLPARRADVINLSLSGGGFLSSAQSLYSQVASLGSIVVAAAGNDNSDQPSYPAAYSNVISVSAVNINKARARYSNYGTTIDVAAPGGDAFTPDINGDGIADLILSTGGDDSVAPIRASYELLQGTSMASPHVAGVAALMKAVHPGLDAAGFANVLAQGLITDDLGAPGRDNSFGYGLINANKAVLVAESLATGGSIVESPSLSSSAAAFNFGDSARSLPLTLSNGGTGDLTITSIVAADTWLSVTPVAIDGSGLGSYAVEVDRSQLPIGSHSSSIAVSSSAGSLGIQVILQKPDPNASSGGDAGLHYILLINAVDGSTEQELVVAAVDGQYHYEFTDVPAGVYQIFAGSDADNDFFICDAGEACGAWPVLDSQPASIDLRENRSGLDFSTTFITGIISGASVQSTAPSQHHRSRYQARENR
jgi:serine protease